MAREKVPVNIRGMEFTVETDAEPLYIHRLARYIETRMQEVFEAQNVVDTTRLAVLTALKLADELFQLQDNKNLIGDSLDRKTEELIILIDNALKS